jgi:hypothetical protein
MVVIFHIYTLLRIDNLTLKIKDEKNAEIKCL